MADGMEGEVRRRFDDVARRRNEVCARAEQLKSEQQREWQHLGQAESSRGGSQWQLNEQSKRISEGKALLAVKDAELMQLDAECKRLTAVLLQIRAGPGGGTWPPPAAAVAQAEQLAILAATTAGLSSPFPAAELMPVIAGSNTAVLPRPDLNTRMNGGEVNMVDNNGGLAGAGGGNPANPNRALSSQDAAKLKAGREAKKSIVSLKENKSFQAFLSAQNNAGEEAALAAAAKVPVYMLPLNKKGGRSGSIHPVITILPNNANPIGHFAGAAGRSLWRARTSGSGGGGGASGGKRRNKKTRRQIKRKKGSRSCKR